MLDRLVLADRPVEYDAFLRIFRRALERDLAEADRFGGDQDALRVHAVEYVFEAAAFLADTVGDGYFEAVDKNLVGVDSFTAHFRNFPRLHELAVEVRIKQAQSLRGLRSLPERRRARGQQHLVGDLRGRNPDFLARHDVMIAVLLCFGLQPRRIEADVGFSHAKTRLVRTRYE